MLFFDVKQNNYKLKDPSKCYIQEEDKEMAINTFLYKKSHSQGRLAASNYIFVSATAGG